MAAAPVAETVRAPLRAAVDRRSPLVASALDPGRRGRGRNPRCRARPSRTCACGSVRYRPDGGATLRYRVRLAPSGRGTGPARRRAGLRSATSSCGRSRPIPACPRCPARSTRCSCGGCSAGSSPAPAESGPSAAAPSTSSTTRGRDAACCATGSPRVPVARVSCGIPSLFGKVYADPAAPAAAAAALRVLRGGARAPGIRRPRAARRRPRAAPGPRRGDPRTAAAARAARDGGDVGGPASADAVAAAARAGRRRPCRGRRGDRAAGPRPRRGTGRDRRATSPCWSPCGRRSPRTCAAVWPAPWRWTTAGRPRGRVAARAGPRARRPHAGAGAARVVR